MFDGAPSDQSAPRFSLLNGEGSGAMLAAAVGDVAGGASPVGYSAITQQATVVAYHLLRNDGIDRPSLTEDWLELAAEGGSVGVYRSPSPEFESFLKAAQDGEATASAEPSAEPAARIHPVGVWFRRHPDRLVESATAAARLTHTDATSVLGAVAMAGAVAASCFAQAGGDLLRAAAEVGERCLAAITAEEFLFSRVADARSWLQSLHRVAQRDWMSAAEVADDLAARGGSSAVDRPLLAMIIAAPVGGEPYRQVEQAAALGGTELATMVGAIVGARVGLRSWPWVVPNDTWFAEIGRRLVNGNRETRDIPVPHHVEERLTFGGQRDLM
ncbi:MAG: ADP-ribosylglycohydrolase family protein [Acidimicrobiia bacterium]|nr:ADP-ribosylglycohydrolase family protein [Acidimicrobiia bacterium]